MGSHDKMSLACLNNSTGKQILEICGARSTEYLTMENGEKLNAELLLEPIVKLSMRGEKIVHQVQSQQTKERELIVQFFEYWSKLLV